MELKLVFSNYGYMLVHEHPDVPRQASARTGLKQPWFIGWIMHDGLAWEPFADPWEPREYGARCPVCGQTMPTEGQRDEALARLFAENHFDLDYWML